MREMTWRKWWPGDQMTKEERGRMPLPGIRDSQGYCSLEDGGYKGKMMMMIMRRRKEEEEVGEEEDGFNSRRDYA